MPSLPPEPQRNPGQATSMHVNRAAEGDATSTTWLIERLNPLLLAQASWRMGRFLRRVCEPADLVHDAWMVLLPRLASLPPRDGRMTPVLLNYLSTTILRKAQNLLRHHARRRVRPQADYDAPGLDSEPAGPRSEVISSVIRREVACRVRETLNELSEQDREIILMRGIEQRPTEEITEALGLSLEAMYKRYRRALTRLREQLPDSVFGELLDT